MNAIEILGLACVDKKFRELLFTKEGLTDIIAANRTDLTWAEEAGLRRITQRYYPKKSAAGTTSNGPLDADSEPPLKEELEDVGKAIAKMCPEDPCPWPMYFVQYDPTK